MFAITRPINGISINGNEFLLDHNDKVKTFTTRQDAVDELLNYGMTPEEIGNSVIEIVEYGG